MEQARKRLFLLVGIMTAIVIVAETITIAILYRTALGEQRSQLAAAAKSQARLIEGVARFDRIYSADYPHGARAATLSQIGDAHSRYGGFSETGEFTLSQRDNDQIVFLLSHRHDDLDKPKSLPWDSYLGEPERLALSGKSGVIIGLDYRGEKVLAAHEPVAELDLGIVAKIDLAEVKAPFLRAGIISGIIAALLIIAGACLFFTVTNPILHRLNDTIARLQMALSEVKTLRGILPICSFCKKIRDDSGYWDQVESYVKRRSDADFSHGICPDCLKKHYPEEYSAAQNETSGHNKTRS